MCSGTKRLEETGCGYPCLSSAVTVSYQQAHFVSFPEAFNNTSKHVAALWFSSTLYKLAASKAAVDSLLGKESIKTSMSFAVHVISAAKSWAYLRERY